MSLNNKTKKELDTIMRYLLEQSCDSLRTIKSDPENVIYESELEFDDNDYELAKKYIKSWKK